MKKIIKYIAISILIFSVQSCIDEDPQDQIWTGGFFNNTAEVNQAVLACYNGLQSTISEEWAVTEVRSDNSRHYGMNSTTADSRELYGLDHFRLLSTHVRNKDYWDVVYHNIANCNTVLQYLDVVADEDLRNQFEAEALFIRSYHYFNLVRLYGPLFLVTERIDMDAANRAERSSVNDVYTLLTDDLERIVNDKMLPTKYSSADKGRVDIWTAKTLLAKIYLTLNRLSEARTLLLDVEANSGYSLLENSYEDVFSINNEMNKEMMFVIRFKAGGYGLGSPFANYFAPQNSQNAVVNSGGNGHNCPTNDIMNAYEPEDKRKDVTVQWTYLNTVGVKVYMSFVKKYLSQVQTVKDAENDWPVIRYADVILMLAEIENELSGPSAGLPYLNQIRTRAGLDPLESTDVSNKNQFRLAVEKERRLEFAFENHRFFDLVRTGRLIEVMKNHYDTEQYADTGSGELRPFYEDSKNESYLAPEYRTLQSWQLLLPIPYSVMSVAPNATQNPGY
ncbi:RagB/SusD family nutrient uptake outer membrane protein [Dysgonomonas sp. 511]|uniref:RagB/SusD family nutrient uptake outer membrane protein n=1 Tax=Dysgonomonas sp. 511 TaxID=2302930 RepID=UPI0013CF7814|nr:RagB/SusD family nutrient uptake outer membrane protein [Dysgonomonas sp. 511]NDV77711.1 RagB/SusD family nutrient uptake outer membrane protein [Dysgonomonas sp. 511]